MRSRRRWTSSRTTANVSTNGFKRSRAVFEELMYQTVRQPGAMSSEQTTLPSGLQLGTGVRPAATERIHLQGNLTQTGNPTDVAINGKGFFGLDAGRYHRVHARRLLRSTRTASS